MRIVREGSTLWVEEDVAAPADAVWRLLVETDSWPSWGPSVRSAQIDGPVRLGAHGSLRTIVGLTLPFEIVDFDPGRSWRWQVGGVPATDHRVGPQSESRCRAGIGVPWPAAPYLAVAAIGLRRLARRAEAEN